MNEFMGAMGRGVQRSGVRLLRASIGTLAALLALVATAPPAAAETGPMAYGQGLLWRIDTPGVRPSYLFGTIHLSDPRATALPPPVTEALTASDSLSVELVLDGATQQQLGAAMVLTGGRTLDGMIGTDLFAEVVAAARPYGLPEPALRMLEPWAVMAMLSIPPEELARTMSGQPSVDQLLQNIATANGIRLHALETVTEQVEALSGMSDADEIEMLRQTVDQQSKVAAMIDEMVGHYVNRDIGGLHAFMLEQSMGDDPALLDRFLDRILDVRNRRMVDRMADVMAEGNAFVAVGALHLPGDTGLLSLLEQRGHSVSRVY
ncbi:MAG: TraB/GumN family protein [Inquilinus sp.]|nr:TraB/GumN family protein [Inquilinus sp.]